LTHCGSEVDQILFQEELPMQNTDNIFNVEACENTTAAVSVEIPTAQNDGVPEIPAENVPDNHECSSVDEEMSVVAGQTDSELNQAEETKEEAEATAEEDTESAPVEKKKSAKELATG